MATPWFSTFAIPQLPPTPNMSLYVFQDKNLEQQVYSSQMQWLGVDNGSGNPSGNSDVETTRKENEVLRWLGECVLRGLTGVLLMTLFPELEAGALEVRVFFLFSLPRRNNPPVELKKKRKKNEKEKKKSTKKERGKKKKRKKERKKNPPILANDVKQK